MTLKNNDIIVAQKEEAEEIMPVSSNGSGHFPFKEKIASSNLVAGANNCKTVIGRNDITFNWNMKQDTIDGRTYSRLSFQT